LSRELLDHDAAADRRLTGAPRLVVAMSLLFLAAVVYANVLMFAALRHERAFGALLGFGNVGLAGFGAACGLPVKRLSGGASMWVYVGAVVCAPLTASAIGLVIVVVYGMGGC
jgi:hypothetical protein